MKALQPGWKYNPEYTNWTEGGNSPRTWQGEVASGPEMPPPTSQPFVQPPGGEPLEKILSSAAMPSSMSNELTEYFKRLGRATPYNVNVNNRPVTGDLTQSNEMLDAIGGPPSYKSPDLGRADYRELPTYSPRSWDDKAVSSLAQKKAMPGIRELRSQMNRVSGRRFDNPAVGKMTLRDALQGYGSGLGSVISGAGAAATGEYGTKFAREGEEGRAAYASLADRERGFNAKAMREWETGASAKMEGARQDYTGKLRGWETKANLTGRSAEDVRKYELDRRSFDDAWQRWKQQQNETMRQQGQI